MNKKCAGLYLPFGLHRLALTDPGGDICGAVDENDLNI